MARKDWVEKLEGVLSMLILGAGFLALFAGFDYFFLIWILGFAVLLPIVSILFDDDEPEDSTAESIDSVFASIGSALNDVDRAFHEHVAPTFDEHAQRSNRENGRTDADRHDLSTVDALEVLRERYARGDLTDRQFERKLDYLLGTTTPENAAEWRDERRELEYER